MDTFSFGCTARFEWWLGECYFFSLAYCTTHSDEFETQMKIVKASKSFLLS